MSFLNTKHKKKSFTLTTMLVSVLLLLLFYVGLTSMDSEEESGISVNFGTTNFGSGKVQPKEKIKMVPVSKPIVEEEEPSKPVEASASSEKTEDVATAENEESIRINKAKKAKQKADAEAKKKQAEIDKAVKAKKDAEAKLKRAQDAKKRSLDQLIGGIGKSDGKATGGEGDDNKAGDKGQPDGDPYASSYFGSPGSGSGGRGYGLNGRSIRNKGKVVQDCNEEGKVVVKIEVDRNGNVVKATPGVRGTTNSHPCLMDPAKKTAMMHKWNFDAKAPTKQVGFVVVNFKLGE